MNMQAVFLLAIIAVLLLTLPYIWRIVKGPTVFDRVQALNGVGTKVPVLAVLIGLVLDRVPMYVDMALSLFLLNLFVSLLVAKYMHLKVGPTGALSAGSTPEGGQRA